jgi:hypothetical protein
VEEEEQPLPPSEEVEAVSSPSFSDWSFLDNDSERNLEDDEDAAMETPEDSPRLEWWEEVERKAEEQEALLESFATARKEERTRVAAAQAIRAESFPRRHGHVPACLQFSIGRFTEVARIWKAATKRCKAFQGDTSCSLNGKGAVTAAVFFISSDEEE